MLKKLFKFLKYSIYALIGFVVIPSISSHLNDNVGEKVGVKTSSAEVPTSPPPFWGGFGVPFGPYYQPDSGYFSPSGGYSGSYSYGGDGEGGGGDGGCDGGGGGDGDGDCN